jgi:hypothetical protein
VWSQAKRKEGRSPVTEIEVRWGGSADRSAIARVLELNFLPGWIAFEERFIVAEKKGRALAAVRYRTERERLLLGSSSPVRGPENGVWRWPCTPGPGSWRGRLGR